MAQGAVGNWDEFLSGFGSLEPTISYSFMLRVEGVMDLPCKGVHSFSKENEYEYIQEGGLNDYVHMRRKPVSKPFTFAVDRYVGVDYLDPMPNGADLILPVLLFVGKCGFDFSPSRCYTFTGCTVTGKQYGALDAERSGLLVETTTIAYRELLVVDIAHTREQVELKKDKMPQEARKAYQWVGTGKGAALPKGSAALSYEEATRGRNSEIPKDATSAAPRIFDAKVMTKPAAAGEPRTFDAKAMTKSAAAAKPRIFNAKSMTKSAPAGKPRYFDPKQKNEMQTRQAERRWKPTESHKV